MNRLLKFTVLSLMMFSVQYVRAGGINPNLPKPDENDSTINLKSNIVLFKMITTSSPNSNSSSNTGSLKKAGRVARTSYSHTSIESILYKKKGI